MILGNLRLDQYLPGLKSVKYFTSGADALPEEVFNRWQKLTGKELLQTWGASEMFVATHNVPGQADLSLGTVLPGYELGVLDFEEDRFLGEGEKGELAVKGDAVLKAYLKKPEETKESLVEINGGVWYRSGDVGRFDNGKYYFEERKREIIKYKGYNIGASEVEQALYAHEAIKEVAVIGVPDKKVGEIVKAVVVLHEEAKNVTLHDLLEICRQKLSPYKIPKHIEFRDALPKSPHTGKILKRELRQEEILKRGGQGSV
jgi:long-chain acyl-CoA synthetase